MDYPPICYYADNVDSLLEMLYEIYARHNSINSEELGTLNQKLHRLLRELSSEDRERAAVLVRDVCREHEQLAFIHGFIVGLCLMTEIRAVD